MALGLALGARGEARAEPAASPATDAAAAVFERAGCHECHNAEGVASDTRLVFPEPGSPGQLVAGAVAGLLELLDLSAPANSRLLRKPTKRLAHEGGQKITPGSADEKAVLGWLTEVARLPSAPAAAKPAATSAALTLAATALLAKAAPPAGPAERGGFRRLTHAQYDNTVRDLLGDITGPARNFPPEDFVDGFKNQYQAQSASPVLAEAYGAAAEKLAGDAARSIALRDPHRLLPCKLPKAVMRTKAARSGGGVDDSKEVVCRDDFIRDFGRRAFRRPLGVTEHARYVTLFAAQPGFLAGVKIVVEAMLQAPSFLYLVDTTDEARQPFARAARLAYFLWNTMPDDALLDAAARGDLASAPGVASVSATMTADPRAQQALDEYVAQWLRLDRVREAVKDRRQFPMFTPEIGAAMAEETRRSVTELVVGDGNFMDLFSADYSFVNSDLAAIYGLAAPAHPFDKVKYPAASGRAGVLSQGTFLTGTSKPADTSPTARGLFVREQFLCQKVPTPPPGVNMNLPPLDEDKPTTNRQRLGMHLTEESCARCHNLIDSIGFGFEKFDAIGRRQDKLKISFNRGRSGQAPAGVELPLDTRGAIAGLANSSFTDAREIGIILSKSGACQRCMATQVFRYATGRHETPADRAALDRISAEFRQSGFKFRQLLISVAQWTEFTPPGES